MRRRPTPCGGVVLGLPMHLHCCMAIAHLQLAFIQARLGDLPKGNAVAVQRVLYRARTGARFALLVSRSCITYDEAICTFP